MKKYDEYYTEIEKFKIELYIKQLELSEREKKRKAFIRLVISSLLAIIVIGSMLFLFTTEVPAGNRDVLIALVSGLTGAFFGTVIAYYFGDSDSRNDPPAEPKFKTPEPEKMQEEQVVEDVETNEKTIIIEEAITGDPGFSKE